MYEANQMIRYKFIDTFGQFKARTTEYGMSMYKGLKVNTENAEWFLFQIGRDIQMAKNIIDIGLRFDNGKKNYSYDERDMYSFILKAYIHFISDWEKDIKVERTLVIKKLYEKKKSLEDNSKPKVKYKIQIEVDSLINNLESLNCEIETFVKTIIDTKIMIKDDAVYLFSNNSNLIKKIKQKVLESKFTFNEVDTEKAKSWWA